MGLFSKLKEVFSKKEEIKEQIEEEKSIEIDDISEEDIDEIEETEKISKEDIEDIKETDKYVEGLSKSRDNFVNELSFLGVKYTKISDDFYDELEEILITADIGVNTVMDFVDRLRKRVKEEDITDFEYLKEVIVDELFMIYVGDEILSSKLNIVDGKTNVVLFVGVNGVGKTTSIAKIAYNLKKSGKKVMLIAGDTFRAGAVTQLDEWAKRIKVDFFGDDRTDPSAVIFDGLTKAKNEKYDVVLVDTAGRLQNKVNLMKELEKMNKVITEIIPGEPCETLLVIDATTGQNGISQAKSFKEITNITGIVLTKLDGTAKGGIVLAIKELVDIPVKYVGLGEKETDLIPFDIEKYIYGLFKEF